PRPGLYVLWTLEIDRRTNVHEATWQILQRGDRRVIRKAFRLRLWTLAQWRRRLREAGLRLVRAYGDFKGRPFRRASGRLLILAERVTERRGRRGASRPRP
ncbi:MAG TPA: hypothetical protein VIX40_11780, partial [Methylomirabilota bacterium]